jgi:hypothetical protein
VGNSFAQVKKTLVQTNQPLQYMRVDIDIELVAKWKNPYLSEEVALDMLLTTPSGRQTVLPCFYDSGESGKTSLWKARFAPQESGTYTYAFRLSEGKKVRSTSRTQTFDAAVSGKKGFLHTASNWALRFDNGTYFRGVGENICWESRTNDDSKFFKALHERKEYNYDEMLPALARNGGNFFRTWICAWNLPIDFKSRINNSRYTPSDAFYNPSALARMDHLVELSDSLGLYIMLTLGTGGYHVRDGGLVSSADAFFADAKAKERYKNRLRYLVARWGYSTSIAMWEFFNEVDNVQHNGRQTPIKGDDIVAWHREMSAFLKQTDPYGHIVTTSISHRDIEGLNDIPDIDINQKHIYNNTAGIPSEINKYTTAFHKPYVIGEFGYEWDWSKNFDDFAAGMDIDFKRGLWYGLFSPTPVLPMSWWWEYFDARRMTPYFRGVRAISDRMLKDGKGAFKPLAVQAGNLHAFGLKCGETVFVYLFNPEHATYLSGVTIRMEGGAAYRVQSYEPATMRYEDASAVGYAPSAITLTHVVLGAEQEILYILTPLSEANTPPTVDPLATPETKALHANLLKIRQRGVMFGHHDYPSYGIGWRGDKGRSDVKDLVGDHPAVYSLDMHDIKPAKIELVKEAYRRGGVSMLVWHQNNPLTEAPGMKYPVGSAWDNTPVVNLILTEGSEMNRKYKQILDRVADVLLSMKDDDGTYIPVIFRPLHEHTQSWNWWGTTATTDDEFIAFWRFIVHYLRDVRGVHNVLYAISPQMDEVYADPKSRLLFRWPGDEYVDFIGMDCYHGHNTAAFASNLKALHELSATLGKPAGVTETGIENNHPPDYWTKHLLPSLKASPVSMVVAWRNDNPNHAYGPYPTDPSADDFKLFHTDPFTLFEPDLPDMYR